MWSIRASVLLALAMTVCACDEKVAQGGACKRHSECVDGLTCAPNMTCQTHDKAKELRKTADEARK